MVWRKAERANPPQLLSTSVRDGIAASVLDRALLRLRGAHLLRARYVRNEHENDKRSAQPIHEGMFHRLGSTCAPLSVHSGGKPIALPTKPATPGPRPKASQADSLGAPPSSEPTRCIEGGEGSVLNGLAPVTSSLLKSAPKDAAKS